PARGRHGHVDAAGRVVVRRRRGVPNGGRLGGRRVTGDALVLPPDARLDPLPEAADASPIRLGRLAGGYVVRRDALRGATLAVDRRIVPLLERFRTPGTIADTVLAHAGATGEDPSSLLEQVFPVLGVLIVRRLLVPVT